MKSSIDRRSGKYSTPVVLKEKKGYEQIAQDIIEGYNKSLGRSAKGGNGTDRLIAFHLNRPRADRGSPKTKT